VMSNHTNKTKNQQGNKLLQIEQLRTKTKNQDLAQTLILDHNPCK